MSDEKREIYGIPVVVSDAVTKDEMLMGRFPTAEEVLEHGSVEKAIEAQQHEWVKIKGIGILPTP